MTSEAYPIEFADGSGLSERVGSFSVDAIVAVLDGKLSVALRFVAEIGIDDSQVDRI